MNTLFAGRRRTNGGGDEGHQGEEHGPPLPDLRQGKKLNPTDNGHGTYFRW